MIRKLVCFNGRLSPLTVALLLGLSAASVAEEQNESAESLEVVEVKGQTINTGNAVYSGTVLVEEEIRDKAISSVQQLFRYVPGMSVRTLGLTGVADNIVLRGMGNGGHGGDIAFIIDGIPLNEAMSHADGYADLNVIVPLELSSMTVQKGPVSPLYGNYNRAGTVALETRKGNEYRELDISVDSFGTVDAQTVLGVAVSDSQQLNLAAQLYRSDGFRSQSESWRGTLAARWRVDISDRLSLAVSGRLHEADADNPGYLSQESFDNNPYGVEPGVQNDGAEKGFYTLRTDLQYLLSDDIKLLGYAYSTLQDFSRWFTRPRSGVMSQREESYDRQVYGAGFSLNGRHTSEALPVNWVAGLETLREATDFEYYEGTDYRQRVGQAVHDRRSKLNSVSAFGEVELPVHALFKPTLGLRFDRFNGDCRLNGVETSGDACGEMKSISHASPKFGLRSEVYQGVELRASWAEGFALASDFAKYSLGAAQLDPNVFRQTEGGIRVTALPDIILDAAVYRLLSSDEIRTVSPGEYESFGATERTGYELGAVWLAHDTLDFRFVWGEADSEITENEDASLLGNRVAGVPRQTMTLEANWRPVAGWQTTLIWQEVGRYQVNAANTISYGGYGVADFKLSYSAGTQQPYTVYFAVDNLADRKYATTLSTIGYATGAERAFRLGTQLSF